LRKRNEEIKRILGDLKNSLNGSIAKKNNKILALIVSQDKFLWSQVPEGINPAYLSDLIVAARDNKNEIAAEFGKKFTASKSAETMPIEIPFSSKKLIIMEAGPCTYFAALFSLKADMGMVHPALIKTSKELERVMCRKENNELMN